MDKLELEKYWSDNLEIDQTELKIRFDELIEVFIKDKINVPDNDVFFNHITKQIDNIIINEMKNNLYSKSNDFVSLVHGIRIKENDAMTRFFKKFMVAYLDDLLKSDGFQELIKILLSDFYWNKHKELVDRGIIDGDGELVGRKE
jgi:hypothetical protein